MLGLLNGKMGRTGSATTAESQARKNTFFVRGRSKPYESIAHSYFALFSTFFLFFHCGVVFLEAVQKCNKDDHAEPSRGRSGEVKTAK